MGARQNFLLLPMPLRVASIFFLFIPILATGLGHTPGAQGFASLVLWLITYWVLPISVSFAILFRHVWFLPLCLAQSFALGMHCYQYRELEGLSGSLVRFLLIVAMGLLTMLFADRDLLQPFISGRNRFWRRSPRLPARHPVEILTGEGRRFDGEIQDCSLTGMGLRLSSVEGQSYLAGLREGDGLDLEVSLSSGRYSLATRLVWFDGGGSMGRVGVAFKNPKLMGAIVASVTGQLASPWHPVRERFAYYWLKGGVKHVALVFWLLSITGAFFLPIAGF
jgi:hypothetical protein